MSKRIFHILKTKRDSIGPIFRLNRANSPKYTKTFSTSQYANCPNNGQNGGSNNDYIIAAAVVLSVYTGVKAIR